MNNIVDTNDVEWDYKEVSTFSEHIYDCSFDEIIKKGYNPEDPKERVDIYDPPIIFSKLKLSVPKKYDISKTENMVFGTKLGVSILQHDTRIKEIINKTGDCFDELDEFQFRRLTSIHKYSYATPCTEARLKMPGLEWVIEFIRNNHENLGMTIDQLFVESYLLGIFEATKINGTLRPQIKLENDKFWVAVDDRLLAIE